jgi:CRP-like cAMP-binding protein
MAALEPDLHVVNLSLGQVLAEAGQSVTSVLFPHSGVISLVVELASGDMIETAMIGRDGVFNASPALDASAALNKAIVQLEGTASSIHASRFRTVAQTSPELMSVLIRHELVLFAEAQQSAACNAKHSIESRICRWLLRMRDLAGGDDLTLTQEFLAQMIGVRRASVSVVAGTLQSRGLISYNRGAIRILNVDQMRSEACECYAVNKAQHSKLLGPRSV